MTEHSGIKLIQLGRLVRIDPAYVDTNDVIELAEALIEEHGHVQQDSGDATRGWSIHGALGEAAHRLTNDQGKDKPTARRFRDDAAARILANEGRTELEVNDDPATDKQAAIDVLRRARGETT